MVLSFKKSPALRALLGVLFLLVSFSVYADYYRTVVFQPSSEFYSSGTIDGACEIAKGYSTQDDGKFTRVNSNHCEFSNGNGQWYSFADVLSASACPDGTESDPETGECSTPECPAGTINLGTSENPDCAPFCNEGRVASYAFPLNQAPPNGVDGIGCLLNYENPQNPECVMSDPMYCSFTYIDSGQYVGTDSENPLELTPLPNAEPAEKTNIKEQEKTPEEVTTDPDGTVNTKYSETDKTTNGIGTEVIQIGDNLYRIDSTGAIVEVVKQHEINSYPDGSGQETIIETLTKIPASITETIKDLVTGEVTGNNYIEGPSGQKTTVVNKYYDSNGEVVSSDTTSTGEIDTSCTGDCGDSNMDMQGGDYHIHSGQGDYVQATAAALTAKDEALTLLSDKFSSIKSEMQTMFSFSGSGSGSLPCPPPVTFNIGSSSTQFDICLTNYEEQLSIVAVILVFIATFLAIAIILR